MASIPPSLQGVLWSKTVNQLDLAKDKSYVIHQILRFGSLSDIRWLFDTYPAQVIKQEFIRHPQPIYSKPALNFIKNTILNLGHKQVDESRYLQSFY
mgnify:CR=1 FL=1